MCDLSRAALITACVEQLGRPEEKKNIQTLLRVWDATAEPGATALSRFVSSEQAAGRKER